MLRAIQSTKRLKMIVIKLSTAYRCRIKGITFSAREILIKDSLKVSSVVDGSLGRSLVGERMVQLPDNSLKKIVLFLHKLSQKALEPHSPECSKEGRRCRVNSAGQAASERCLRPDTSPGWMRAWTPNPSTDTSIPTVPSQVFKSGQSPVNVDLPQISAHDRRSSKKLIPSGIRSRSSRIFSRTPPGFSKTSPRPGSGGDED